MIPQSAISFTLYGENVYVIHEADGVKRAKQVVVRQVSVAAAMSMCCPASRLAIKSCCRVRFA